MKLILLLSILIMSWCSQSDNIEESMNKNGYDYELANEIHFIIESNYQEWKMSTEFESNCKVINNILAKYPLRYDVNISWYEDVCNVQVLNTNK